MPVVATDVGGMPEAVIDDVTGFLLPPGTRRLWPQRSRILSDPAVGSRMRQAALARFEQRFTMERMLEAHRDLYAGCTQRDPPGLLQRSVFSGLPGCPGQAIDHARPGGMPQRSP